PSTQAAQPDDESVKKGSGKKTKKQADDESGDKDKGDEGGAKGAKKGKGGKKGKSGKKDSDEETQGRQLIVGAPVEPQGTGKSKGAGPAAGDSEAIRDAELAIQKDSNLAEAHLALGFALLAEEKNYDRALAAFVRASTVAPEDAEAYFGVGYTYR